VHGTSIFLSYTHRDGAAVRRIAQDLAQRGVQVWLDEAAAYIGDELTETIRAAIVEADYVAIVLSQKSIRSSWVEKEATMASAEEARLGREEKLILIKVEDCEVPEYLADREMVDFTSSRAHGASIELLLQRLQPVGDSSASSEHWPDPREAFARIRLIKLHVIFYDGAGFTLFPGRVGTNDDTRIDDLGLRSLAELAGLDVGPALLSRARFGHLESSSWLHEGRTLADEGIKSGDHIIVTLGAGSSAGIQDLAAGAARAIKKVR
jgi:TIR domain